MTSKYTMSDWNPCRTQSRMLRSGAQHIVACCSRQRGKSHIAMFLLAIRAATDWGVPKSWHGRRIYCVYSKSVGAAHNTLWQFFLYMTPKELITKINHSNHHITLVNGAEVIFCGVTNLESAVEGNSICGVVVDEMAYQIPGKFVNVIEPMLTATNGWSIRIGVPKRNGKGSIEFKELCEEYANSKDPGKVYFHWTAEETMTKEQVARAKSRCDIKTYREQYLAEWQTMGGSVYYAFTEKNILADYEFDPEKPLYVSCDFNVSPMAWVMIQENEGKLIAFDELWMTDTNTPEACRVLAERYSHAKELIFCGDATGRAWRSSSIAPDWTIIEQFGGFVRNEMPPKIIIRKSNPHISDRIARVNSAFENALGESNAFVAMSCPHLIKDLRSLSFKEGTNEVDLRNPESGHIADAFGYAIYLIHPGQQLKEYR